MTVTAVITRDYEKKSPCRSPQNKPNSNPIQTHFAKCPKRAKKSQKTGKKRIKMIKLLSFRWMDDKNTAYTINSAKVGKMKRRPFRKKQRLKTNSRFRAILADKCSAGNKLATLYVAKNNVGFPRFGISVSKKCGNAPLRNHIKRLARESFRKNQHDLDQNYDYLLIFSPKMTKTDKWAVSSECGEINFARLNALFLELASAAQLKVRRTAK